MGCPPIPQVPTPTWKGKEKIIGQVPRISPQFLYSSASWQKRNAIQMKEQWLNKKYVTNRNDVSLSWVWWQHHFINRCTNIISNVKCEPTLPLTPSGDAKMLFFATPFNLLDLDFPEPEPCEIRCSSVTKCSMSQCQKAFPLRNGWHSKWKPYLNVAPHSVY